MEQLLTEAVLRPQAVGRGAMSIVRSEPSFVNKLA